MSTSRTRTFLLLLATTLVEVTACTTANQYMEPAVDAEAAEGSGGAVAGSGGKVTTDASHSGGGGVGASAGGTGGAGAAAGSYGADAGDAPQAMGGAQSVDAPQTPDAPPICNVGDTRCALTGPAAVEICMLGKGWAPKETCSSVCSNGACSGSCLPNSRHCGANQTPEVCSAQGQWVKQAACAYVCSGAGDCTGECKPGNKQCVGPQGLNAQTCDGNGSWQTTDYCMYLCASGVCMGECSPGDKKCSADGSIMTCSSAGRWVTGMKCPNLCNGGMCAGMCVPGRMQCSGTTPQICDSNGNWTNGGSLECRKTNGQRCGSGGDCVSNNCVRNICCNSSCGDTCYSCAGSDTGGSDGTCAPVKANTDPLGQCPTSSPSSCGTDGTCDGKGACKYYGTSQVCAQATCSGGMATDARHCDGNGSCGNSAQRLCGYFGCADTSKCNTGCPTGTNDTGSACTLCGGQDQPCCNKGSPCQDKQICFIDSTSNYKCGPCGVLLFPCCGSPYTNVNGMAPVPGRCDDPNTVCTDQRIYAPPGQGTEGYLCDPPQN